MFEQLYGSALKGELLCVGEIIDKFVVGGIVALGRLK